MLVVYRRVGIGLARARRAAASATDGGGVILPLVVPSPLSSSSNIKLIFSDTLRLLHCEERRDLRRRCDGPGSRRPGALKLAPELAMTCKRWDSKSGGVMVDEDDVVDIVFDRLRGSLCCGGTQVARSAGESHRGSCDQSE